MIRRHAVAPCYLAALAARSLFTKALPPAARDVWIGWVSTNLANLTDHPVAAMVISAFVPEGDALSWLAVGAIGLVGLDRAMGNARTLALITAVHVVGTLVSEGIVAVPARALSAVAFVLLGPDMFGGLPSLEVSSVGHVVVLVTALTVGALLPSVNLGGTPGHRLRFCLPARRRGWRDHDNPDS